MVDAAHMKNVNSLLGQIRDYQTQAQQGVSLTPNSVSETSNKETVGFGEAVKGALTSAQDILKTIGSSFSGGE